jgi:hypothetical protein
MLGSPLPVSAVLGADTSGGSENQAEVPRTARYRQSGFRSLVDEVLMRSHLCRWSPPTVPSPGGDVGRLVRCGVFVYLVGLICLVGPLVQAADPAVAPEPAATKAASADTATENQARQERFRTLVTGATLVGRFTIDRDDAPEQRDDEAAKPDGRPPAEMMLREEEYAISAAVPLGGDLWLITSRIRYGDKDLTVPVPVAVKWAGDTPVITLDKITIPGLGTFSCRVVLDDGRYAGTWQHDAVGGHMFGQIRR